MARNDQRHPDAGLIDIALGAMGIEGRFDTGSVGTIVAYDYDHRLRRFRTIVQASLLSACRESHFDQEPTDLCIHRFNHLVAQDPLLKSLRTIEAAAIHRSRRQQRSRCLLVGRVGR